MTRRSCLLTGSNGLLGSRLLPMLQNVFDVYCLVNLKTEKELCQSLDNIERIHADLRQPFQHLLPSKVDYVIHLAQSPRYKEFPDGAIDVFRVNTASTMDLLDYSRRCGVQTFVYASSGGVYPKSSEPLSDENSIAAHVEQQGFYRASKLSGELLASCYSAEFSVVNLRYFFIYGPGQQTDRLVPGLISRIESGVPVHLQGKEGLRINPVFVDDAAAATLAALQLDQSATINVAGPETVSLRSFCEVIGKLVGRRPLFEVGFGPEPSMVADIGRMKEHLRTPVIGCETGLRQCIAARSVDEKSAVP